MDILAKTKEFYIKIHIDDPTIVSFSQASAFVTEFSKLSKTGMRIAHFMKLLRHRPEMKIWRHPEPTRARGFASFQIFKD